MRRFLIGTMALILGLTVAASQATAGGKSSSGKSSSSQVSSSHKYSNSPLGSYKASKPVAKDFHKGNPNFHDRDYCKHFTSKWWCASLNCYCYWSPIDGCYFFWYKPWGCYCPYDYITLAYPNVVVTQPPAPVVVAGPMTIVTP